MKDLTKDEQLAVSIFKNIRPKIEEIKNNDTLTEEDKKESAYNLILSSLCMARNIDPTVTTGIKSEYVTKVRNIVNAKPNIDAIIQYMNCMINK